MATGFLNYFKLKKKLSELSSSLNLFFQLLFTLKQLRKPVALKLSKYLYLFNLSELSSSLILYYLRNRFKATFFNVSKLSQLIPFTVQLDTDCTYI